MALCSVLFFGVPYVIAVGMQLTAGERALRRTAGNTLVPRLARCIAFALGGFLVFGLLAAHAAICLYGDYRRGSFLVAVAGGVFGSLVPWVRLIPGLRGLVDPRR